MGDSNGDGEEEGDDDKHMVDERNTVAEEHIQVQDAHKLMLPDADDTESHTQSHCNHQEQDPILQLQKTSYSYLNPQFFNVNRTIVDLLYANTMIRSNWRSIAMDMPMNVLHWQHYIALLESLLIQSRVMNRNVCQQNVEL
jgi:hypothetical protein